MILLLSISCGILLILLMLFIAVSLRASRQNLMHEEFFKSTLEEIKYYCEYLDELSKRQFLSDDPDVQNVHKGIKIIYNILMRYMNGIYSEEEERK